MERFFCKPSPSSGRQQEHDSKGDRSKDSTDLLGQLRNAAVRNQTQQTQQDQHNQQAECGSSEQLWDPYFSRNSTYSISDISLSNRIANSGKSLQGWKIVDKKRVYTTFRNGRLVQGEGAEGYKLAIGDAPTVKGRKRGSTEITKNAPSSDVNENYNSGRVLNSRSNSCIIPESSKKLKECPEENLQENLFQNNQHNVSQNGVYDFSFG